MKVVGVRVHRFDKSDYDDRYPERTPVVVFGGSHRHEHVHNQNRGKVFVVGRRGYSPSYYRKKEVGVRVAKVL